MNTTHEQFHAALGIAFDFVTPVWGYAYTSLFLEVSLPSYFARGNLPALTNLDHSIYRIYTMAEDAMRIGQSRAIARLKELMRVEVHIITDAINDKYARMSFCHQHAIAQADSREVALVFLPPDAVIADGSVAAFERLAHAGKRVILGVGLRLHLEKVVPLLKTISSNSDSAITISPRELMRIALNNLHPITMKHIWDDSAGEMIPTNLFWPVNGEGLLGRCFHLHPMMVYPRNKHATFISTIDDDYVLSACPDPQDWHIVTDSDEILVCELTTVGQNIPGLLRGSIKELIRFAETSANMTHQFFAKANIFLHTGARSPAKWAATISESDRVMNQVFEALKTRSSRLLLTQPALLLHRLRRLAYELDLATQPRFSAKPVASHSTERFAAATIGRALNQIFKIYTGLVHLYIPIREKIIAIIFGTPPKLLPWHWCWLEYGLFFKICGNFGSKNEGECLFVSASTSRTISPSSKLATLFYLPPGKMYDWPYENSRFATICLAFGPMNEAELTHSLAEATRLLRSGGHLVASGLAADWVPHHPTEKFPASIQIVTVYSQGNWASSVCVQYYEKMLSLVRRLPAKLVWETALSPLLIIGAVVGFGLINITARIFDRICVSKTISLGTILVARKTAPENANS